MRKGFMSVFLLTGFLYGSAQSSKFDRYTVSGGLLGGSNMGNFRLTGPNSNNFKYETAAGWAAGAWLNIPAGRKLSLEPQLLYSNQQYSSNNFRSFLSESKVNYLSLPVLLKLKVMEGLSFTAGPQFDFVSSLTDRYNLAKKEQVTASSLGLSGGFELFPNQPFSLFARYIHGLTNMEESRASASNVEYFNKNVQFGAKVKLFGKRIAADSDGDGIPDEKDMCPQAAGTAKYNGCPVPDTDGDGINDELDKCPNQAGSSKYNGCPIPDSDGDGINDELDKCPRQKGTAKYNGCPVPDSDGDGVDDENDKCPREAGPASNNGCPLPPPAPVVVDTDGDGVPDSEDRCPNLAGPASNKGCPVLENFQAYDVTFATGSAVLTPRGKKELDIVTAYMKANPGVSVRLDGHTDNTGKAAANLALSKARSLSAKKYIVSKGIDAARLSTDGFGSAKPIADNKTADGRAKNRRVEVSIL